MGTPPFLLPLVELSCSTTAAGNCWAVELECLTRAGPDAIDAVTRATNAYYTSRSVKYAVMCGSRRVRGCIERKPSSGMLILVVAVSLAVHPARLLIHQHAQHAFVPWRGCGHGPRTVEVGAWPPSAKGSTAVACRLCLAQSIAYNVGSDIHGGCL